MDFWVSTLSNAIGGIASGFILLVGAGAFGLAVLGATVEGHEKVRRRSQVFRVVGSSVSIAAAVVLLAYLTITGRWTTPLPGWMFPALLLFGTGPVVVGYYLWAVHVVSARRSYLEWRLRSRELLLTERGTPAVPAPKRRSVRPVVRRRRRVAGRRRR